MPNTKPKLFSKNKKKYPLFSCFARSAFGVRRFIAALSAARRELIPDVQSDNELSHSKYYHFRKIFCRQTYALPCFLIIITFNIIASTAAAQEEPIFDLGEIVVTAQQPSATEEITRLPSSVTVIGKEDIENKFTTVPELLRDTAGVEVRNYGGFGSFSTVSVRGSEADQVLVLLDGIPMNQASGGAVDISSIPVVDIERIEIFRGSAPVKYGGSAIGGIINVVTRDGAKKHQADAAVSFGSFDTVSSRLSVRTPLGKGTLSAAFSGERSDGDFNFLDDNGTPFNTDDDEWIARRNNDFKSANTDMKIKMPVGEKRDFTFSTRSFIREQGVPGLGNFQSSVARLRTSRDIFSAEFEDRGISFKGVNSTYTVSRTSNRSEFSDPLGEIGLGSQSNKNTTRADTARAVFEWFPGSIHDVTAAAGYSAETFRPFDALTIAQLGKPSRRNTLSLAAEDRISLLNSKLLVIPSYKLDKISNRFSGNDPFDYSPLSPMNVTSDRLSAFYAGARYQLSRAVTIKTNYGRYFRPPSFYELFGDRGSIIGNSDLAPEKGRNRDFGAIFDLGRIAGANGILDVSYFRNIADNTIAFIQNSQRTARPTNIGRAVIKGFEASLALDPAPHWNLSANHTYQNAKDDSIVPYRRGNFLPGRHLRELSLRTQYKTKLWKIYYEYDRAGKSFLDSANLYPIDKSETHNAGVSRVFGSTTVTLEGKNLGDNRISDIMGFPLPGRSYFITIEKTFK